MKLLKLSTHGEDSFEKTYQDLGDEIGGKWIQMSQKMLDFIAYLEQNINHADIWAYISLLSFVLASKNDHTSGLVRISPEVDGDAYRIEYPIQYDRPPFLGRTAVYVANGIEDAAITAMRLFDELCSIYSDEPAEG
jgi:hypothetical protein